MYKTPHKNHIGVVIVGLDFSGAAFSILQNKETRFT
jgi:hypothetical protein